MPCRPEISISSRGAGHAARATVSRATIDVFRHRRRSIDGAVDGQQLWLRDPCACDDAKPTGRAGIRGTSPACGRKYFVCLSPRSGGAGVRKPVKREQENAFLLPTLILATDRRLCGVKRPSSHSLNERNIPSPTAGGFGIYAQTNVPVNICVDVIVWRSFFFRVVHRQM